VALKKGVGGERGENHKHQISNKGGGDNCERQEIRAKTGAPQKRNRGKERRSETLSRTQKKKYGGKGQHGGKARG